MSVNDAKKYLLDDEAVTARELIAVAENYGYDDVIKQTSVAAGVLRRHGHVVREN